MFFIFPVFSEIAWGRFLVLLEPVDIYVTNLAVIDSRTKKVVHTSVIPIDSIRKTFSKKIGDKEILVIISGEKSNNRKTKDFSYLVQEGKEIKFEQLKEVVRYKFTDLNGDKKKEVVFVNYKYYPFSVGGCEDDKVRPNAEYRGQLLPVAVYSWKDSAFYEAEGAEYDSMLKAYMKKLEKKLLKKKKKKLWHYAHYFAVAKKIGEEKRAIEYMSQDKNKFEYACDNSNFIEEGNPVKLNIKTTYSDFFKKYGEEIAGSD